MTQISLSKLTDLELVLRCQEYGRHDDRPFQELMHRYQALIWRVCYSSLHNPQDAEDLTQEVFLKLHDHAFKRRLFTAKREHNLNAWLYRVATNMGYNAIRGRKRRWQRNVVLVPDEQGTPNAEQIVARQEEVNTVRQTLARLPQRQAQLLLLRQMGLSYAECADACNVAPGSVGTLLARAATAFRRAYEEEMG